MLPKRPMSGHGRPSTTAGSLVPLAAAPPMRSLGNGSECPTSSIEAPNGKRRAVFVDVVVECIQSDGDGENWAVPEATTNFLGKLGTQLQAPWLPRSVSTGQSQSLQAALSNATRRPGGDPEAITRSLRELISTERTFVQRMRALYSGYARPLAQFAKSSATRIIDKYDARVMFSKVDGLLFGSERMLKSLEEVWNMVEACGGQVCFPGDQGEWAAHILMALGGIQAPYRDYMADYEAAKETEQKLQKNEAFRQFCDRTKETMYDEGMGRIGLRELIMEPIQRVPRYKLLLEQMLMNMDVEHPARQALMDGISLCNRVASCEIDEQTRLAAHMWGLNRAIDGLPAHLTNIGRTFVDAIDVFDVPLSTSPNAQQETLPCTLFLFHDTVVIAKRPRSSSGRTLAGLDNIYRLVAEMKKAGSGSGTFIPGVGFATKPTTPSKVKKGTMSFKGLVDVHDVIAAQITPAFAASDPAFEVFFDRPPSVSSEKWHARPHRLFVVATPGTLGQAASGKALADRERFLGNLWRAQALVKTGDDTPATLDVMASDPPAIETKRHSVPSAPHEVVESYWNLYYGEWYERELRKHKIALQVDATGVAPPLNFQGDGPPHVIIRAMLNGPDDPDCVINVRTRHEPDESVEATLPVDALSSFVVRCIDRLGSAIVPPRFPGTAPLPPVMASPPRSRSRAGSTAVDILPQRLFGASMSRTRSVTSKASSSTSYFSGGRGPSQASTPATSHADSLGVEVNDLSASVLGAKRSPHSGGAVWYQNDIARPAQRQTVGLEELDGDETIQGPVDLRQSDSNPSMYSDEAGEMGLHSPPGSHYSRARTVSPERDLQRASSRLSHVSRSTNEVRRPLGPRGLGMTSPLPTHSRSASFGALDDAGDSTGSDEGSPSGKHRESGSSLTKRRRDLEVDENHATERQRKRSAHGDVSPDTSFSGPAVEPTVARLPSRRRAPRAPRRRRPAVDVKTLSPDALSNILMEEVGGAEDHAHDMDVDVKQIKTGLQTIRSLLGSTLAAQAHAPLTSNNSICRSPRRSHLTDARDGEKPPKAPLRLDAAALASWLEHVDDVAGELDGSLQMEIEAFKSTKNWLETQANHHVRTRSDLAEAKVQAAEASALRSLTASVDPMRQQLLALKKLIDDLEVENAHLYEAFNEELDNMFADVQLPKEQAMTRLVGELQRAKAEKADLAKELAQAKRKLAQTEAERDAARSEGDAQKANNDLLRRLVAPSA